MSRRAWVFGLSQGTYLSTLIDATPIRADHNDAVRALRSSTDRLAVVNGELRGLARLLRQGSASSGERIDAAVMSLTDAVLRHLDLAARLVADLQPIAAVRREAAHHSRADAPAP